MHPVSHIVRQTIGWSLIFAGFVGVFLPIVPTVPFIAAGALLLAPYIRLFRRVSVRLRRRYPALRRRLKRWHLPGAHRKLTRATSAPHVRSTAAPRRD